MNRVGDRYFDQLERTGHAGRADDIDAIAQLGIRTMRYPLLWERIAPDEEGPVDWSWSDDRLKRLRDHGITPIAGLVHHGSGPPWTHLLDPAWPAQLARYAGAVARRYPWLEWYTPVNEPMTTARFSGLYGLWYPHGQDDHTFALSFMHQVEGVRLAMRAIRSVNPAARLVQTEDLGFTRATPALSDQAEFENERRWATMELLCGRLTPETPIGRFLVGAGIAASRLTSFLNDPEPPAIAGFNYYVLSERFLDDDPVLSAGCAGNGRQRYRDCDAVRRCGLLGLGGLLQAAHARLGLPMAVTEVHLGGAREEQLRWLRDCWLQVREVEAAGIPVRGFTIWSLLGAYDWDSLCTSGQGRYEPGAFDVRCDPPRPTALAAAVRALAAGTVPDHPVLGRPGWWDRCRST